MTSNPIPDSIDAIARGDLGIEIGRNLIHGSDYVESAEREIALFFAEGDLHSYTRDIDRWVFEEPA